MYCIKAPFDFHFYMNNDKELKLFTLDSIKDNKWEIKENESKVIIQAHLIPMNLMKEIQHVNINGCEVIASTVVHLAKDGTYRDLKRKFLIRAAEMVEFDTAEKDKEICITLYINSRIDETLGEPIK